jgi:hypothetical protein
MSVIAWLRSTFTTQDPTTYKSAIDGNFTVLERVGAMFAAQQAATPNMTVVLRAGSIMDAGSLVEQAQQTTTAFTAPASASRIDRIVLDESTGIYSVVTGTPSVSPVAPAIPAGNLPCAQVLLQSTSTAITNSMITDERVFCSVSKKSMDIALTVATFASGTRLSFNQAAAPTGWTQDTTINDSLMRIVSGSGGGSGGTTAFSTWNGQTTTGAHALATSECPTGLIGLNDPGHTHALVNITTETGSGNFTPGSTGATATSANINSNTTGITLTDHGGNGSHTHPLTHAVKYNDFIICTKN